MRAAIISSYGKPEVFEMTEMHMPEINDDQMLVQNLGAAVNPVDTRVRQGKTRLLTGLLGKHVIGADFCRIVIKTKSMHFQVDC